MKVTVSLPADLFQWGEQERERRRVIRSAFVAQLYRRQRDEAEELQRIARYKAAYERQPETQEERTWTDAAAAALAVPDPVE